MNILALLSRRHKSVAVDSTRAELMMEMQDALRSFTTALQKYEAWDGQSIAHSQMLFAEVEVHRERYFNARLTYEQSYGNLAQYNENLSTLQQYLKERDKVCLFQHPQDTRRSASEARQSLAAL